MTQQDHSLIIYFDERTYLLRPEMLYGIVKPLVASILAGGSKPGDTPEANRLAALIRVAVKGVLLLYGDSILDQLFHSREHPHPAKKDDLIVWYTDLFTQFACAETTKHTLEIYSREVGNDTIREITQMASIANDANEPQNAARRDGTDSVSIASLTQRE